MNKIKEQLPILETKNLEVKRGGIVTLSVPSFQIKEGEIVALIGPNGAGKTTLLLALSYLIKSSQGKIYFKGEEVNSTRPVFEYRRKLASVFQEPLLFDTTVFKNVASGLKIRGVRKSEIKRSVMEHLALFGIEHLSNRSARTLSGGEAQRTSLARAFTIQPEILFLDEPFASLDPPTRGSLIEDLEKILRQKRTTTILATHDRMEALRLSDRIVVMNEGKILQIGSPGAVMNQPIDEFVASFVGVETILSGKVAKKDGGTFFVSVEGKEIEVVGDIRLGETVILFIRPENVTLSPLTAQGATSARNVFAGRIMKITPLGFYQKIQLHCGFPLIAYVTNPSLEELSLSEGKEIKASFKATAIHVVRKGEN